MEYFIGRYASRAGKKIWHIHKRTLEQFQSYGWPGNLRELQNVIERSVILCEGKTLSADPSWPSKESDPLQQVSRPLTERVMGTEKGIIEAALAASKGRVAGPSRAAFMFGMPPTTLESRIKTLEIDKKRFNSDSPGFRRSLRSKKKPPQAPISVTVGGLTPLTRQAALCSDPQSSFGQCCFILQSYILRGQEKRRERILLEKRNETTTRQI